MKLYRMMPAMLFTEHVTTVTLVPLRHDEPDGWALGHAYAGATDRHFHRHAEAALQQDDGNYGG